MRRRERVEKTACKIQNAEVEGPGCAKNITQQQLKNKNKKQSSDAMDCRASVSGPAAQPTVQTLNCLVVVLLLITDSMTLENKEGEKWQLFRVEEEKSSPTMGFMLAITANTPPSTQLVQVYKNLRNSNFLQFC